jgi:hypothetical protein
MLIYVFYINYNNTKCNFRNLKSYKIKNNFKIALIGLLLVMGCQKRESSLQSQCVECRPAENTKVAFLIDQTLVEGKKYSSKENERYFYSMPMSGLETRAAVQRLIGLNPNALDISAVVIFLPTKKNISKLKLDQVIGYMVYQKHWSGKYYEVSAYKLSNGSYVLSDVNALKSKIISSNDFRRTAVLLYGDENVNTTISFVDFVDLLNINQKHSELQRFLESQMSSANF